MWRDKGSSFFSNLIFILVAALVLLIAFKFVMAKVTKGQIKTEVYNTVGSMRANANDEQIREAILDVLERRGVEPIKVLVTIEKSTIVFVYTYEMETNYIFTRHRQQYTEDDRMDNY